MTPFERLEFRMEVPADTPMNNLIAMNEVLYR